MEVSWILCCAQQRSRSTQSQGTGSGADHNVRHVRPAHNVAYLDLRIFHICYVTLNVRYGNYASTRDFMIHRDQPLARCREC